MSTQEGAVSPGSVRSRIEQLIAEAATLETDLAGPINKGAIGYIEIRHEIAEAVDALNCGLEALDENYSRAS